GTVHHVAWSSTIEDHSAWREKVVAAGGRPTPVIDRYYFKSVYFRGPSGVLFEIAPLGPGFTTDEPLEHLGERISLPPAFEHLRDEVERTLTPLPNPRARSGAVTKYLRAPTPTARPVPLRRRSAPSRNSSQSRAEGYGWPQHGGGS